MQNSSVDRRVTVVSDRRENREPRRRAGRMCKPKTCRCRAYRWPHRPGGGLCRWPDPPVQTCPTPAGTNRPAHVRRRGARRWVIRNAGLHPIRDRATIERLLPTMHAMSNTPRWYFKKLDLAEVERMAASLCLACGANPYTAPLRVGWLPTPPMATCPACGRTRPRAPAAPAAGP